MKIRKAQNAESAAELVASKYWFSSDSTYGRVNRRTPASNTLGHDHKEVNEAKDDSTFIRSLMQKTFQRCLAPLILSRERRGAD